MPVGFVFTQPRLLQLRRAPQTEAAVLDVWQPARRERRIRSPDDWWTRGYQLEIRVIDGDGNPTSERLRTRATTATLDPLSGERKLRRAVLTVTGWEDITVYGTEPLGRYRPLTAADATACGYTTLDDQREAWRQEHRDACLARLYRVLLGDRRDRSLYLVWTSSIAPGRQGDYTTNQGRAADAGEVLTEREQGTLAMHAHQQDVARKARIQAAYASGTLAERARRLAC